MCIRDRSVGDSFPIPFIQDTVNSLGRASIFSCVDVLDGFYQIALSEESRPLLAFRTQRGCYQPRVLPMGLKQSPAVFSRVMSLVLSGLLGIDCLSYICLLYTSDAADERSSVDLG